MPNDNDGGKENERSSGDDSPDLVGEELGDGARIWRVYDRVAREDDRERIGNWNRGLDNLALFAGLFSAVTTAFIIQLQQDTQPDYARLTFLVLNASNAGVPFQDEPFTIDRSVRTTNCLWIASLLLSLTAALIAIMGKDWIGMYASRPVCNPRQWAEMRTYRLMCAERWHMSGVIASAPVLLHLSLILFVTGLVFFLSPDPVSQRIALGLSLAAGALYCATVVGGIIFSGSPFRSPATLAIRGSISALLVILRGVTTALLVLFRTSISQSRQVVLFRVQHLPMYIISLDQATHPTPHRFWSIPGGLSPPDGWPDRVALRGYLSRMRNTSARMLRSSPGHVRLVGRLLWRKLRTVSRRIFSDVAPNAQQLRHLLHDSMLSTSWTDINRRPTPRRLAQSITLLNDMSPAQEILRATLVALGDMALGRYVAQRVSSGLTARISTEIRNNWRTADLNAFSRYMLADQHLSGTPEVTLDQTTAVFTRVIKNPSLRSENVFFAFARLSPSLLRPADVASYFPDIAIQPRAMRYLIRQAADMDRPPDLEAVVLLASRCYVHDDRSFDLEGTLRGSMSAEFKDEFDLAVMHDFGGKAGLIELVVFLMRKGISTQRTMHTLLVRLLESSLGYASHPCLVHVFGTDRPHVNLLWPSLRWTDRAVYNLPRSLPLLQYRFFRWDSAHTPPANDNSVQFSLARIVIEILSSKTLKFSRYAVFDDNETTYLCLELGLRCLHTQLCHPRSLQTPEAKAELIRLILEKTVLNDSVIHDRYTPVDVPIPSEPPSERCIINILTAVARHLLRLFQRPDTMAASLRLFSLFLSSHTNDGTGDPEVWELEAYLLGALDRIRDTQDHGAGVSLQRLLSAICTLQPLFMARDDLRAAWDRMGLSLSEYPHANGRYWDCETGAFFARVESAEEIRVHDVDALPVVDEWMVGDVSPEFFTLLCLDRSMR